MPVNLSPPDSLLNIAGVELRSVPAALRYQDRDDLLLITLAEGSHSAAVFTQSHYSAAPVIVARRHVRSGQIRALLINAGNANAGTGEQGLSNALGSCEAVAEQCGLRADQVLPFSTGVIGEQLDMQVLNRGIELCVAAPPCDWMRAAHAIMTTDTVAKAVSRQVELDGVTVTLTGIAKGAGMICPDMATMLSYVATDAVIEPAVLQAMLQDATAQSFNRITVDSDTSTNDALVLMASGQAGNSPIAEYDSPSGGIFYQALTDIVQTLATAIIRDAEGATRFIRIDVVNGSSEHDCRQIAYSVAHSPLVKTALFAGDPNWGRLLMAIGKADVAELDTEKISLLVNNVALLTDGQPDPEYSEQRGQQTFAQEEIEIVIDLGAGSASHHVWTSDLSHDYVSINADYRS